MSVEEGGGLFQPHFQRTLSQCSSTHLALAYLPHLPVLLHSPCCSTGAYNGFDKTALTSRDGGKASVIRLILDKHMGSRPIVMIGDGVTDMQSSPPADSFIGYGGVVRRKPVTEGADWFITSFQDLLPLLK